MIHPDWEARLEAMKATVARRANRRIVFRQVGDRLVPVGITSGRAGDGANPTMATTALPAGFLSQIAAALDASNESGGSSGRRRGSRRSSRGQTNEINQLLESLGLGGGPDLEEMMLQEAMRLSQLDEEERVKKQQEEEAKKAQSSTTGESLPPNAISAAPRSPSTTARMLSEAIGDDSALSTSPYTPPSQSPFAARAAASPSTGAPQLAAPALNLDLPSSTLLPSPSTPLASSSSSQPVTSPSLLPDATSSSSSTSAFASPAVASSAASTTSSVLPTPSPSAGYQPLPDENDPETASTASGKHGASEGTSTGRLVDL
jgi:hypothetical protein